MQVVDNEQLSKSAFVTVKFHQASPVPVWQLFATRKALRVEQRSGYSSYEMAILGREVVGSHSTSEVSRCGNFCAILTLVHCLQKRNTFVLSAKAALEAGGAGHSHWASLQPKFWYRTTVPSCFSVVPSSGAAKWRGRQCIHSFLFILFSLPSSVCTGVRAQCFLLTSFS